MPFSSLHLIEASLIAQLLDLPSLLRFARCSRFTLQSASCRFALQHQPPVTVCSLEPNLPSLLSRSILRFARIHLEWVDSESNNPAGPRGDFELADLAAALASASLPPLDSLSVTSLDADVSRFTLDSVALRSLRCLCLLFPGRDTREYPRLLPILPALEDLSVECCWAAIGLLSSLSWLPRLSALNLTLRRAGWDETVEELIAAEIGLCVSLRRLSLSGFMHPSLGSAISERMHQLDELTFTHKPGDRYSADTLDWMRRPPPVLRALSVLAVPTGPPLLGLIAALAATLPPQGPIRSLLLLPVPAAPCSVAALAAALTELIALVPSLDRIAFEPWSCRPLVERPRAYLPTSIQRLHYRAVESTVQEGLPEKHTQYLAQLQSLVAVDPSHVCVAPSLQMQSAQERMEQLRRRFAGRSPGDDRL